MAYNRHYYSGAAVASTLTAGIGSSDTTIPVTVLTGWPSSFPFFGVLDKGTPSEEKIEILAGTTTLTVNRGKDGTTAVPHSNGATLQHCLDSGTVSNHETFVASSGTVTPTSSAPGDAAADGTNGGSAAAADHKHAREAFGSGQSSSSVPGDSAADGTATTLARADHKHARESIATLTADVGPGIWGLPVGGTGLTGATAAARLGGGTASGAPVSGTWAVGDHIVDQTGFIWVCIAAGTPGTWVNTSINGFDASGAWSTWTPTVTGLVVGNGTLTAKYRKINRMASIAVWFQAGSTSGPGSGANWALSLPVLLQPALTEVDIFAKYFFSSTNAAGMAQVISGQLIPYTWTSSSNNSLQEINNGLIGAALASSGANFYISGTYETAS